MSRVILKAYRGRMVHVAPYAGRFGGCVDPSYNLFGADPWNPVTEGHSTPEDAMDAAIAWIDRKHAEWRLGLWSPEPEP